MTLISDQMIQHKAVFQAIAGDAASVSELWVRSRIEHDTFDSFVGYIRSHVPQDNKKHNARLPAPGRNLTPVHFQFSSPGFLGYFLSCGKICRRTNSWRLLWSEPFSGPLWVRDVPRCPSTMKDMCVCIYVYMYIQWRQVIHHWDGILIFAWSLMAQSVCEPFPSLLVSAWDVQVRMQVSLNEDMFEITLLC